MSGAPARVAGFVFGLGLLLALLVYNGIAEVGALLATAGTGLVVVALFHLIPIGLDGVGWWHVLPRGERGPIGAYLLGRWVCFSVNSLLPVMQVGGNVARARLLARRGVDGARAAASVVVDVTTLVFSQVLFALFGLALLVALLGAETPAAPVLVGIVVMATLVGGFYAAQRRGLFTGVSRGVERFMGGGEGLAASAAAIDDAVQALYARRAGLAAATAWHFASWIAGGVEVWIALHLLGRPVSLMSALLLESLGHAVRSAAFAVPGGLGVQETGYVALGRVVDLGPDAALALSLAQRVRDMLLGAPGLVAWWLDGATPAARETDGGG